MSSIPTLEKEKHTIADFSDDDDSTFDDIEPFANNIETEEEGPCHLLTKAPSCTNYTSFRDSVTSSIQKQVNKIVDTLNIIPTKLVKSSVYNTKIIGHKFWAFGDMMAGTDTTAAPIQNDTLIIIDKIFEKKPHLVATFIERSKILQSIPIEKRAEYIAINKYLIEW
jgi:hypothetical protein